MRPPPPSPAPPRPYTSPAPRPTRPSSSCRHPSHIPAIRVTALSLVALDFRNAPGADAPPGGFSELVKVRPRHCLPPPPSPVPVPLPLPLPLPVPVPVLAALHLPRRRTRDPPRAELAVRVAPPLHPSRFAAVRACPLRPRLAAAIRVMSPLSAQGATPGGWRDVRGRGHLLLHCRMRG